MTATVNVAIALRQILDGAAVPFARVKFTLTDADVDGALLLPVTASITVDADGNGSVKWWPNARGTQGTQTLVSVYDAAGKLLCERAATIPAQDCNLHDVLHMTPPPTQDDGVVAVNTARAWASQWAGDIPSTLPVVAPSYSARYYSEYARSWATLTGAEVPGVPGARSAMSWAQEDLRGVTYGGSARDWAIGVGAIDGVSFSAKGYAALAAADRVQTGADATATAGDRVQTGVDRAAAAASDASARGSMLTATAQAALASTYAAQAGSVVQQDLSGTTAAALYRSPNNVVATCFMDTTKDSDPSWPLRTDGTSYAQEALNGTWLGAHASEMDARDYFGSLGAASLVTGDSSTFTNGSGAWGARNSNGSVSVVAGRLRLTCSVSAISGAADLTLANLTVGQRYRIAFTRGNISAGKNQFVDVRTGANGAGTALTSVTLGSQGASLPTELSFVATQTTHYVAWYYSSAFAQGEYIEMDDFTVQPVDLSKNPSGAYYQNSADGKFYRLWKNLLRSSNNISASPWTLTNSSGTASRNGNVAALAADGDAVIHSGGGTINTANGYPLTAGILASGTGTVRLAILNNAGGAIGTFAIALTATPTWYSFSAVQNSSSASLFAGIGIYGNTATGIATVTVYDTSLEYGAVFTGATSLETKADSSFSTQSETFRGNSARPPRFGLAVAEASRVTIFDLLSPGRPMWMVFASANGNAIFTGSNLTSLAYREARLLAGTSGGGVHTVDFAGDRVWRHTQNSIEFNTASIAQRNAGAAKLMAGVGAAISNNAVNAVAMTTLPDAPVDPVTGLQVPTIVAFTAGGVSLIQSDGSVKNSTQALNFIGGAITPKSLFALAQASAGFYYFLNPGQAGAGFNFTVVAPAVAPGFNPAGSVLGSVLAPRRELIVGRSGARVALMRFNEANPAASLIAQIADTYATGWWCGDIRRCLLADTVAGVVSTADNLVPNGDFSTTQLVWGPQDGNMTVAINAGRLEVYTNPSAASNFAQAAITTVPGYTYSVSADFSLALTADGVFFGFRDATPTGSILTASGNTNTANMATAGTATATFIAQSTTTYIRLQTDKLANESRVFWDNIKVVASGVPDRSYKAKPLTVNGSLAKTAVASAAQLVAYSGFSATNYLQEAYSADLDTFGSVTAWASLPAVMPTSAVNFPDVGGELVTNGDFSAGATGWTLSGGWSVSGGVATHALGTPGQLAQPGAVAGKYYRVTWTVLSATGGQTYATVGSVNSALQDGPGTFTVIVKAQTGGNIAVSASSGSNAVVDNISIREIGPAYACDRSAAAGAYWRLGCWPDGSLVAEVCDSVGTVRTVTTTTSYSGQRFMPLVQYESSGALTLKVNGRQAGQTTGAPLGSLANASAVLTVGNSRSLNAAWPGDLCLLDIGQTVPSDDAALWMYEQEARMFNAGAQITLPDSGAIVDMSYDAALDYLRVASAANTSHIQGLVRLGYTASAAGSIAKVDGAQGCKVVVRTGTNPGVDYSEPALNLKEELQRRAEEARRVSRVVEDFDWQGSFTANTTLGSTIITVTGASLSIPRGASLSGVVVSGTGIPAGATILYWDGANSIQLSAACTATGAGVTVSMRDVVLPLGWEAKGFSILGTPQQEKSTVYTRSYNGFRESLSQVGTPNTGWLQVNGRRVVQ